MFSSGIVLVRDVIQVLDQSAQAVAVRRDEHSLARPDNGRNRLVPIGQHARHGILQALGARQLLRRQVRIARVETGIAPSVTVQRWRRYIVASTPHVDLLVAVPFGGLFLFKPCSAP